MHWYVAETNHRSELIALAHLKLLTGIQPFLPTRLTRIGECDVEEPLFPNYLLIAFDLMLTPWKRINRTQGLKRLLGDGEIPRALPDGIGNELMLRCPVQKIVIIEPELSVGEMVKVSFGPYAGKSGKVVESKGERVRLLMMMFNREAEIPVQRSWVARSSASLNQ